MVFTWYIRWIVVMWVRIATVNTAMLRYPVMAPAAIIIRRSARSAIPIVALVPAASAFARV